ncbi:MAG: MFS transporter, partial [Rikenellaceae bacterium]
RQTWAFIVGKFMSDGVWWFFLFWTPAYISDVYGYTSDSGMGMVSIFVIYLITMLSIYGGKLPSIIMNKSSKDPYAARMQAMLIFAFFPLLALFAQPLGEVSIWLPVIIIGIVGAAHSSWAANIYSTVSDMFPKSSVGTIIGIGTTAGGVSSFLINKGSGMLFTYADETSMQFMGFEGKPAGYFIIFIICSVSYLVGWCIMKLLVPRYAPIRG